MVDNIYSKVKLPVWRSGVMTHNLDVARVLVYAFSRFDRFRLNGNNAKGNCFVIEIFDVHKQKKMSYWSHISISSLIRIRQSIDRPHFSPRPYLTSNNLLHSFTFFIERLECIFLGYQTFCSFCSAAWALATVTPAATVAGVVAVVVSTSAEDDGSCIVVRFCISSVVSSIKVALPSFRAWSASRFSVDENTTPMQQ